MTFTDLVVRITLQLVAAAIAYEIGALGLQLVNLPSDLAVFGGIVLLVAAILFAARSSYLVWRKR